MDTVNQTGTRAATKITSPQGDEARACFDMLLLCGELDGKREGETAAQYLRRLIDALIEGQAEVERLRADNEGLRTALQEIMGVHARENEAATIARRALQGKE